MTIRTRLGNLGNILDETPDQSEMLSLQSRSLLNAEFEAMRKYMGDTAARIDCTFDPRGGLDAMRQSFERICKEAEDAVRGGCLHIVLTDANIGPDRAALPMILAAGAVHSTLCASRCAPSPRSTCARANASTCTIRRLIGVGATTVNAYLAEETIAAAMRAACSASSRSASASPTSRRRSDEGLLKVMSKMGISVLSSYRGGCNFEAVGLSRSLVAEFFPGMPSRISGIGLRGIQEEIAEQHARAFDEDVDRAADRRLLQGYAAAARHNFEGALIHMLQDAVNTESYATYKQVQRGGAPPAADQPARPARLQDRPRADRRSTRSSRSPRSQALGGARHERSARWGPRRTRRCRSP
jgi:glutamate synthase (NADPH/NADH) large chain